MRHRQRVQRAVVLAARGARSGTSTSPGPRTCRSGTGPCDWIEPSAAYSPSTGFHSVNTSGGSPAAISDSSLASPVALGMLDSVTWMSGWVALNSLTIWLSSVSVAPDHMVCQVMLTTLPADLPDGEAAAARRGRDRRRRPGPARRRRRARRAPRRRVPRRGACPGGDRGRGRRCRACIFLITRCSFFLWACISGCRAGRAGSARRRGRHPTRRLPDDRGSGPALSLTMSSGSGRGPWGRWLHAGSTEQGEAGPAQFGEVQPHRSQRRRQELGAPACRRIRPR